MHLSNVDLPLPLWPTKPTRSPGMMSRLTLSRAWNSLKWARRKLVRRSLMPGGASS